MPIVHVRALPQKPGVDVTSALKLVCCDLAAFLGIPDQDVMGTWQTQELGKYVVGKAEAHGQPENTHPPMVQVFDFEGRPPQQVEQIILRIAKTLSAALGINPANLFITYSEAVAGRTYSRGQIRRE